MLITSCYYYFLSYLSEVNDGKPDISDRIHSSWTDEWHWASSCAFPFSAANLCLKHHGKLDHHHSDPFGFSPSDSYVFLSPEFFCFGNIFYFCLCSQNASQYCNWRQDYLLRWLFHSEFFCHPSGATEFYLLAAMSYDCYVAICKPLHYTTVMSSKLHSTCSVFLVLWFFGCHCATYNDSPTAFLCLQCHQSLLLWVYHTAASVLFRHTVHRSDGVYLCSSYPHLHLGASDSFLHVHNQDNSENPFCSTKKKSLFYMLLSHDCGLTFLWKLYLYVHKSFC